MKKLLKYSVVGLLGLTALTANADALSDRVEALEYQSYENFFKFSGSLEYRFDRFSREDKKAYTTSAGTNAVGKKENSLNKVFLNIDLESKPSQKLSFYGRLAMRKYVSTFTSSNGTSSSTGDTGDFGGSTPVGDDKILVERAFANYNFSDSFTLTFGRLPTSKGAPHAFSRDEAQGGNYPFLLYSSNLDGIAGTYTINSKNNVKAVYSPFTTADYSNSFKTKTATSYVLMYEFKSKVSFADQLHFILGNLHINKFTYGTAVGNIDRYMLNTEILGLFQTNLDMNIMFSNNRVDNKALSGGNGWASNKLGKVSGNAYGAAVRYAVMANTKLGVEYFHADKDAWATQSTTEDPFNFYSIKGDSWKIFATHKFDQNFRVNVGYITSQQDYEFSVSNLLGKPVESDRKLSTIYTSLIANF